MTGETLSLPTHLTLSEQPLAKVEYALTSEEFLELNLLIFQKQRRRNVLSTLVAMVAMLVIAWVVPNRELGAMLFVMGLAPGMYLIFSITNTHRLLRDYFRRHPHLSAVTVITLDRHALLASDGVSDSLIRWPAFTHVGESRGLLLLHRGPQNPIAIPKRAFATPADAAEFRTMLEQLVGRTELQGKLGFAVIPATPIPPAEQTNERSVSPPS